MLKQVLKFRFSYLILLVVISLLSTGCAKEHNSIFIEINNNAADSNIVYFELQGTDEQRTNTQTDAILATQGSTPLKTGRYLTVYAYFHGETDQAAAIKQYKCTAPGTLEPVSTPMVLDNGTYDFYIVGTNMPYNLNPTFTKGTSIPLDNNVDYLWCKITDVSILNEDLTVPVSLNHICSKIIVNITESFLTFIWDINWVKISAPAGNQTMNIFSGEITPSNYPESNLTLMNLNTLTSSFIILPYEGNIPLEIEFSVYSNLHLSPVYFEAELYGEFTPGKSYIYDAKIVDDILDVEMNAELDWTTSSDTDIN